MLQGGCLCGAVRWTAESAPKAVHHCHCSMCRRWTGGAFATLAWFARDAVRWTGTLVAYRSSPIAVRTYCGTCGTPLYLAYDARNDLALTAGSLTLRKRFRRPTTTASKAASGGPISAPTFRARRRGSDGDGRCAPSSWRAR
jgi:hypothetical protein